MIQMLDGMVHLCKWKALPFEQRRAPRFYKFPLSHCAPSNDWNSTLECSVALPSSFSGDCNGKGKSHPPSQLWTLLSCPLMSINLYPTLPLRSSGWLIWYLPPLCILTITLLSRLGWWQITGQRPPSKLHGQMEIQTQVTPFLVQCFNHHTMLALH